MSKKGWHIPALLQKGERTVVPYLVIFPASLATGYVLAIWRQVKAVFIPKPGMSSYSGPRDFTPISLTSTLLKTMKRFVDRFLRDDAIRKASPSVQQRQKALNDIFTLHSVGLRAVHQFVGPEPTLGISRQNVRQRMKRWMGNQQHMVMWRGLIIPHRQLGK